MANRLAEPGASVRRARALTTALFLAALAATFAAQARTLSFWFFQDDLVPYGEIVTNGNREYLWRLALARDLTPNWRVIPGLLYLGTYRAFGLNPLPMHIVLVLFQLGTAALLFRVVLRTTGHAPAAFVTAVVFGLQPAYAGSLGQVAVAPHIAAAFFLVATLNAIVEFARAETGGSSDRWLAASVVLYALAILSNESMAALFPAFGLAFLLFDADVTPGQRWRRAALRTLPFAAIGLAAVIGVRLCDCTEASGVYGTEHAPRVFLIYAGRLLWPIGLEPPTYIDPPHLYAAFTLLALSAAVFALGPPISRVGIVWMLLAIVPHIFVKTHTANRFTYLATPGFALLAAGAWIAVGPWLRRAHARAPAAAGLAALAVVMPWYAWQTHLQNEPWRETTSQWESLHDELVRVYPEVPDGAHVQVIGGPLTHPLDQFFVMPALGYTIWGPNVTLTTFAEDDPFVAALRASGEPYIAEFRNGRLERLRQPP